jgi:hypothetical protein
MARAIAELYGPETDSWTGKYVTLYADLVKAFGEDHLAIRVKAPAAHLLPGYVTPHNHTPIAQEGGAE